MMDFHEKSIYTLELPAVLELLQAEAVSEPAKERSLGLRPLSDIHEVTRRQKETSAAKTIVSIHGNPPFYGVKDVGGSLARADAGGMLNTRELLDIAAVLRAARSVRA
jgi:DNA mismatch repair protein MutS2